jgi:hypothetical protein
MQELKVGDELNINGVVYVVKKIRTRGRVLLKIKKDQ